METNITDISKQSISRLKNTGIYDKNGVEIREWDSLKGCMCIGHVVFDGDRFFNSVFNCEMTITEEDEVIRRPMLINIIKADITTATRMRNQLASDILKVVLGECQTKNNFSDDFIIKYCRDIVKGNTETMKFGESVKLSRENELLRSYLPKELSKEELEVYAGQISGEIKAAQSDKHAIGVLIKYVKSLGLLASGDAAKELVSSIRNVSHSEERSS